jgi:hypothetical protein
VWRGVARGTGACRVAPGRRSAQDPAGRAHASVNTVETDLTNVYRKLGIRRRWQLIASSPDPDHPNVQPPE